MHKIIEYKVPTDSKEARTFSYMMFFYALSVAILAPVLPKYMMGLSGGMAYYVGIAVAICSLVTLFSSMLISKMMHRLSRIFLLYMGFLLLAIVFIQFLFAQTFHEILIAQIIRGLAISVIFVVIPLMIRDYTDSKSLAREEGVYYWFINLAWVGGPLLGGFLAGYAGVQPVFMLSIATVLMAILFLRHKHVSDVALNRDDKTDSFADSLREFFRNPFLRKAYVVDFGLYIWWSIATVCVPLYLVSYGLLDFAVGIVLSVTLIPLLILEKSIGKHTKQCDLGSNMRNGFILIALAIVAAAVVYNVYFSVLMFFVASIGAAFIEPIKETYLFSHMDKSRENDLYPVYSTARQLGYLVGPLIGGFVISFLGYQALFLITAFALLPMVFVGHLITKE